ncbi:MAG TPA: hypothetical protein PLU30_11515 [Verrucomicrobiae bacterium]|nr:hypothetical protein [Verrucomicrobiae bacterium]
MRLQLIVTLVFASGLAAAADAQMVRHIETQRPLRINTQLVEGGKAAAIIAASAKDASLASQIVSRVRQLTGVQLAVVDDANVTDADLRRADVIVIGNHASNKVAERLYVRDLTFEDYVYPGIAGTEPDGSGAPVTGYVIRTVHDPFGFGRNCIVLAGSEPAGTAEAVKQFAASLDTKGSVVVPQTVKVRFGTRQLMKPAYTKNELPQAQVDRIIEGLRRQISRMTRLQDNIWYSTESYAMGYHLTGNSCWGQIYKAQMEILAENLERFNSMPNNYIEGVHKLLPAWELMEETPFFSDAERLKMVNVVLEVAYRNATAWEHYLKDPRREAIDSHGGERVQSLRLAGLYFGDRYGINRQWVTMSDEAINFMNTTPRSCDGYRLGCGHCTRLNEYARRSGDMRYLENRTCRQQADLVMACTDNQGYTLSIGDAGDMNTRIDRNWNMARFMGEVAWYYKDPSYVWFTRNLAYHELPFMGFVTGEKPPPPERFIGLVVLPMHPVIYGRVKDDERNTVRTFEPAPPLTVKCEEAFDKLMFREGLDPNQQYLLLDGVSGMDHGHIDGNGIARFSDLARIWLFDVGWTRVYPRDHNMLLVVKDGASEAPQKFTRLDFSADTGTAAFTKTTIPDYSGVDWSRHLFWLKGGWVLALDRAVAKGAGNYTLRCRWRSTGEAAPQPDGLLVTQSGPRFRILNVDGSRRRLREAWLDDTGDALASYPHVGKGGETIMYDNVVEKRLAPGESHTFQNLFYATSDQVRRECRIERVDDSTVRIVSQGKPMVAGIGKDGSTYMLSGSKFWVAHGTSLGQPPLFQATQPVDIEYDLATGRGTVVTTSPARVTILGGPASGTSVAAGRHPLMWQASRDGAARLGAMLMGFRPTQAPVTPARPTQPAGLTAMWETRAVQPCEILDMAVGDLDGDGKSEIITAGDDGSVSVLGFDGKMRWRRDGMGRADSVTVARFDGKPHVVVGCRQSPYIFVFDGAGTRIEGQWAKLDAAADSYKGVASPVRFVAAADMNGDGADELLAANRCVSEEGMRGHVYCYDAMGRMIWQQRPVEHELCAGAIGELKPGGPKLLFVGGSFGNCAALNGSGREVFRAPTSHRSTVICAGDVDGDGDNEVLIGGNDNYVHLHGADGKRRWMHNVGGPASGIEVIDVNGDHEPEIVVATAELNANVFALKADGTRVWQFAAGEEVHGLAVGSVDSRSGDEIVLGTDGEGVLVLGGQGKPIGGATTSGCVARLALCPGASRNRSDILAAMKNGSVVRLSLAR